ncbi:hypothetical protein [Salmonella enterica]|uniref:hypothetical protein n=1 Tax=Salmonella enterica TaxID=28901 RepID=UPI001D40C557|nr:hypothetical protein [Salmonella enterica]HCL5283989.1 hypothetical protein [Salmonella enterica]
MKKIVVCVLGALLLSGCSIRAADLTLASTKNININSDTSESYKLSGKPRFIKGARVTGTNYVPVVLVPFGVPDVEEAADSAIEQDHCAVALSDVVINQNNYSFLFGALGFEVEGDLVIDRMQPGCENRK